MTLTTASDKDAGTRAPVWLELGTAHSTTGKVLLLFDEENVAFDAGQARTFVFDAPAVRIGACKVRLRVGGALTKLLCLQIGIDSDSPKDAWRLRSIDVSLRQRR